MAAAGALFQGRVSGAFEAVREAIPDLSETAFPRMDGKGQYETSRELVGQYLDSHPKEKRVLIAAAIDTSALGAVAAVRERRRRRQVAIVVQDCIADAMTEMKRNDSPMIGTISYETATYGPSLMHLALNLLRGQPVPPYNYVAHKVVFRKSVVLTPFS